MPEVHWDRLGFFTDLTGEALDMQVVGSRAYVIEAGVFVNGQLTGGGLRVLDVSDPRRPVSLGRLTIAGQPGRVALAGDIACVAAGSTGLHLIDVSNPAAMTRRGGLGLNGAARSVQVAGNLAYVAATDSGLHIVDLGNPAQPARRGGVNTIRGARDVAVACGFAYVTEVIFGQQPRSSLHVFDVSVPASPRRVGEVSLPGFEPAVRVVDKVAYVTSWANWSSPEGGGLTLIDVSEPSSPVLLSRALPRALASSVDVVGHLAFVGDRSQGGLQVFDVSDPARPRLLNELSLSGAGRMWLSGRLAYVTGSTDYRSVVHVLDLSQPDQPVLLGGFRTGDAWDLEIQSGVAYVAAGNGLEVFLLNFRAPQPLRLELPGRLPFPGTPLAAPASNPSGLRLAFTIAAGPARMENQQFIVTGLGPVTLRVEQPGDDRHLPTRIEWTLVVHPPTPRLQVNGTQLELAWPTGLPGLVLLHRETLSPETPWRDLTVPTVEFQGEVRALLEALAPTGLFQLVHP